MVDTDGSGQIDFDEFQAALARKLLETDNSTKAMSKADKARICVAPFSQFDKGNSERLVFLPEYMLTIHSCYALCVYF